MAELAKLHRPWMVAVWPGVGHVALNAGHYLLAKLDMHEVAELQANSLFDVEEVDVRGGIIQAGEFPRNQLFIRTDPRGEHDLVVFVGESQPPVGKYLFCKRLIDFAKAIGVQRVLTFAALATNMHPSQPSRVFGAACDRRRLEEMKRLELPVVEDGCISGLNGILLGAAVESGMSGGCLLGEMPHVFNQLPYPKASLAILDVFSTMSGIDIDLGDMTEQVELMDAQLGELLAQVEQTFGPQEAEETFEPVVEESGPSARERDRIEKLFALAKKERAKAFELKHELDRLRVFREYEDRFLDLFTKRSA